MSNELEQLLKRLDQEIVEGNQTGYLPAKVEDTASDNFRSPAVVSDPELNTEDSSKVQKEAKDTPKNFIDKSEKPLKELSVREQLLQDFRESRKKYDKELKESRRADMIAKAIGMMVGGAAQTAIGQGGMQTGLVPKFDPQSFDMSKFAKADQIAKDKQTSLDNMLKEFKLLEEKQEGLTPYQRNMLTLKEREIKARNERESRVARNQTQVERKRYLDSARGLIKDDPRYKLALEQVMAFENIAGIIQQVEAGNEQAVAALGTTLAKAMGEKGMLTDTDVVRYIKGTSWGRQLSDFMKKGAKGTLSEDTLTDIKSNIKTIKGKLNNNLENVYSGASKRLRVTYPELSEVEAKGLLGYIPIDKTESPKEEKVSVLDPKGTKGSIPKRQLEKALKLGYKLVE